MCPCFYIGIPCSKCIAEILNHGQSFTRPMSVSKTDIIKAKAETLGIPFINVPMISPADYGFPNVEASPCPDNVVYVDFKAKTRIAK